MKIKFSVIESEHCNHHVERIIDTYDYQGIIADINKVLDLRELGTESHKLKSAFIAGWYSCADVPPHDHADSCGRCLGCLTHTFVEPKPKEPECECPQDPPGSAHHASCPRYEAPIDVGPHTKAVEYDGAFKCYECNGMWGALPGKPIMPAVCEKPVVPPTPAEELSALKDKALMWLAFGPANPHGPTCGCDAEVGFQDPECRAWDELTTAVR